MKDKDANVKSTTLKKTRKLDKFSREEPNQEIDEENEDVEETPGNVRFEDSDDDIEEELRDEEALDECMAEISKPSKDIIEHNWVLVSLAGKKSRKFYVGQVVSVSNEGYEYDNDELEIKFTKRVPTLKPLASSTFCWTSEVCAITRSDIVLTLPKSTLTKRGLIKFDIDFSAYNVQ